MSGELLDAVQLLLDVELSPEQQITQTQAEDMFGLTVNDFTGVRCEELENPHNPKASRPN